MIRFSTERATLRAARAEAVACFAVENEKLLKAQLATLKGMFRDNARALDARVFAGKEQDVLVLHPGHQPFRTLILVGLGRAEKLSLERLRRGAARAAKEARKARSLAILEPDIEIVRSSHADFGDAMWENIAGAMAEGAALALYRFDKYRTVDREKMLLTQVKVISADARRARQMSRGVRIASVICEATYLARDLANAPGNEIHPESLAARARSAGRAAGFRVTVLNERKIRQLNMGGLLGVARGSDRPPRFIIMEYRGAGRARPKVVLVGKGVTFDSGGISIKPAAHMAEMRMDMSGAAVVIGTMQAVAQLKLPVHVIGLVPATENLLGGSAMKPGDILTHHNGMTSEVDNTDAEGRLILADALSYASQYKPDLVIDLATLTGACVVALGHHATGMMGNDEQAMTLLRTSGDRTYERVWQLPMYEEYERLIKSDVADVKNVGGRWAGAITAAMFLKKFIGDYRWVHLDIAGTAIMEESFDYIQKGASGVGVRLLVDFLRSYRTA